MQPPFFQLIAKSPGLKFDKGTSPKFINDRIRHYIMGKAEPYIVLNIYNRMRMRETDGGDDSRWWSARQVNEGMMRGKEEWQVDSMHFRKWRE